MREIDNLMVDRSVLEVFDMEEADLSKRDLEFWLSKSPIERLEGIEFLRQSFYSYDPLSERFPRFFEITGQE